MAVQNFDEINKLKRRSIPYEEYFKDMELTEKQRKERIDLAYLLEDILIVYFMLYYESLSNNAMPEVTVRQNLMYDFYDKLSDADYFGKDAEPMLDKYISDFVDEISEATKSNMEKTPDDYDYTGDKPYWVSDDRAKFIAENEANTLCNNKDFVEAKKSGKTHKIWMAFPDDRVRPTHVQANGSKVPIDDYFSVGGALMLFPKDTESEFSTASDFPEEVIGCRCSIKYI